MSVKQMFRKFIPEKKYTLYILVCSSFLFLVSSVADIIESPWIQFLDIVKIGINFSVVFVLIFCVCFLLASRKYLFLFTYPVLVLLSSILSFFRFSTKTVFSATILEATLTTDFQTSAELITWPLILYVCICLLVAVLLVWYRFKKISFSFKGSNIYGVVFCGVVVLLVLCASYIRGRVFQRIPFNVYSESAEYFRQKRITTSARQSLLIDVKCPKEADSLIVVFVIGESLRADHLGLNGYKRNTTPNLSNENVTSLPNIYTPYTHTNGSIPFIMTRADEQHKERAYNENSFIELYKACGFSVTWLANQEPTDGYIYFMKECDTIIYPEKLNGSANQTDGILFPYLNEELGKEMPKKLVILHTIGSHWWYNLRYEKEFAKFQPHCQSNTLAFCSKEEIINSYDNTILYTDYFVDSVIQKLKTKTAVLIFLADHAESLGENGYYLHASDNLPCHNPASFIWMSDSYKEKYPQKYTNLQKKKQKEYSTSFLFHSILDAANIRFSYFEEEQSIF